MLFSSETMEAGRQYDDIKCWKKKKKLARDNSIYRKFVLQKNEGEFKIFPGKQINPKGVY